MNQRAIPRPLVWTTAGLGLLWLLVTLLAG